MVSDPSLGIIKQKSYADMADGFITFSGRSGSMSLKSFSKSQFTGSFNTEENIYSKIIGRRELRCKKLATWLLGDLCIIISSVPQGNISKI